jgi:ribosomal protein S12 methylthiotransferase
MIDSLDSDSGKFTGRTQAHAPEVDGVVYMDGLMLSNRTVSLRLGDMIDARISGALDYDLIGEKFNAEN